MDNANLDTTFAPLALYAQAELFLFQNKLDKAYEKLDSILLVYPDHSLQDDVYFAKAKNYEDRKEYDQAVEYYTRIMENHADDIRADNAIYALAKINEDHFGNLDVAKELYQKIFLDFSDSTFAIDARKRFRILRGDDIQ